MTPAAYFWSLRFRKIINRKYIFDRVIYYKCTHVLRRFSFCFVKRFFMYPRSATTIKYTIEEIRLESDEENSCFRTDWYKLGFGLVVVNKLLKCDLITIIKDENNIFCILLLMIINKVSLYENASKRLWFLLVINR